MLSRRFSPPDALAQHIGAVARALLGDPNPQQSKRGHPRWGTKGSLAVDEVRGVWFDHEHQVGGGVLDLVEREKGLRGPAAIDWLRTIGCHVDQKKPNGTLQRERAAKPKPEAKREIAGRYDYYGEDGEVLFQTVRMVFRKPGGELVLGKNGKPDKTFLQRRPDPDNAKAWIWGLGADHYMRKAPGQDWYRFKRDLWDRLPATRERRHFDAIAKPVPYRLAEIIEAAATKTNPLVLVVEGEKKADALAQWNIRATCNAGGAGKWTDDHARCLAGCDVVIAPDADDAGREHANAVAQSLQGIAARVRILDLAWHWAKCPPKGDVADWIEAGGTREQLEAMIGSTRDWQPQSAAATIGRELVALRASDIAIEPVEWLWPGRVAIGKQALMAGEAGLGKSQISIGIAAAVTTGGEWPCGEGRAPLGSVLFLCAEDGAADTIVPRLMAAGADLDRVHIVSAVRAEDGKGHRAFNLQADLDLLARKIGDIGDVRLIVIDPISSYMGPKVDSHVNAAVRGVLEPVGELATRLRIAILSITHPPKGTGSAAVNRFIGSIAFVAAARSAFMVTRDAEHEDRRLFLPVKNNLAPLGNGLAFRLEQRIVDKGIVASAIAWESSPVTVSADEALRAAEDTERSPRALDEAVDFLAEKLASGPVPVREVEEHARALGISKRTIERARKVLDVRAVKTDFERGWSLVLPHDRTSANQDRLTEDRHEGRH
jgi:hypothetical protein